MKNNEFLSVVFDYQDLKKKISKFLLLGTMDINTITNNIMVEMFEVFRITMEKLSVATSDLYCLVQFFVRDLKAKGFKPLDDKLYNLILKDNGQVDKIRIGYVRRGSIIPGSEGRRDPWTAPIGRKFRRGSVLKQNYKLDSAANFIRLTAGLRVSVGVQDEETAFGDPSKMTPAQGGDYMGSTAEDYKPTGETEKVK
jgi:hypothetical protein